jgi:GTPase
VAKVDVRGGTTIDLKNWTWESCSYKVPGLGDSEVVLVDTPGMNEVDGSDRARLAREASEKADLILFVVDADLNASEAATLIELVQTRRPVFVVLNKIDRYGKADRERLLNIIRKERIPRQIDPENVIPVSADPPEREVITIKPDGTETSEWSKPAPQVENLRLRILEVLEAEGKALLVLNAALFTADRSDKLASVRVKLREKKVNDLITRFAVIKGTAVAFNPVPVADVLGGTACDFGMVYQLAQVYGYSMSWAKARQLVNSIAGSVASIVAIEIITHSAAGIFKGLTFGLGTVVTAVPQGGVAAFGTYIVGQATKVYFENNASWGKGGPKPVVQAILKSIDKKSVLTELKQEIQKTLDRNKHAGEHAS